jgi:hypothetical protein
VWPAEALRRDLCVAVGKPDHVVGNGHLSEYLVSSPSLSPGGAKETNPDIALGVGHIAFPQERDELLLK